MSLKLSSDQKVPSSGTRYILVAATTAQTAAAGHHSLTFSSGPWLHTLAGDNHDPRRRTRSATIIYALTSGPKVISLESILGGQSHHLEMQTYSAAPDRARDRRKGALSKHAILNNALHTHAHQNPPKPLRRPRPHLSRHKAYVRVKLEPPSTQGSLQDALLSHIDGQVEAYKQKIDVHSILPAQGLASDPDPFTKALKMIRSELAFGTGDVDAFCGSHAHPAALLDAKNYKTAPRLCQIIADLLHKLRPTERLSSVTTVSIMWLHWSLWTWLISPSIETYTRLPEIMRPSLIQISHPHDLAVDFIPSPTLRDSFCQRQANRDWPLSTLFQAAFCYGPKNTLCSLMRDPDTQALDITPECKAYAKVTRNWSFDTAVGQHAEDDLPPRKKRHSISSTSTIDMHDSR